MSSPSPPKASKAAPIHAAKAWRWGIDGATGLTRSPSAAQALSACGRRSFLPGAAMPSRSMSGRRNPSPNACSVYAGAMLAPRCEEESAEPVVSELGKRGIALWRETYPGTVANGTLVVALDRDRAELDRFARMTGGHRRLSPAELAALEPALGDRFAGALFYPRRPILRPRAALRFLLDRVQAEGVALAPRRRRGARGRRSRHRLPRVSPPRTIFRTCAACAASGLWSRAAR